MSRALPIAAAALLGACAHGTPPADSNTRAALAPAALKTPDARAGGAETTAGATSAAKAQSDPAEPSSAAPVHAQWRVKSRGKGFLELIARVERRDLLREALKVHVKLPPEVAVESGEIDYTLLPVKEPGVDERVLRLRYTAFPEEPLLLSVDAEGDTFTLHATSDYRFGRSKLQATNGAKEPANAAQKPAVAAP